MVNKLTYRKAFTLVELLISIVVVAILAAISVTAFSNIQDRAYATDLLARTDAYEKALKLYHIENGRFPDYGTSWGTCLGQVSDYPAEDDYPEGACMKLFRNGVSDGYEYVNENVMDGLKSVITPFPSGKIRESKEAYTSSWNGQHYERFPWILL